MSTGYTLVTFDEQAAEPPNASGAPRMELPSTLQCEELRANVWYLSPGDSLSYHRQRKQEELYVQLDGPGRMHIDDKVIDVPEGSAVRVAPEIPRRILNDTDEDHTWLVVGAPPADDDGVVLECRFVGGGTQGTVNLATKMRRFGSYRS